MSSEVFKAKSGAELAELTQQGIASITGESGWLRHKTQSTNQKGTSKANATRKLSIMLNYMLDLSNYMLDLSNYAGASTVLSNACIA